MSDFAPTLARAWVWSLAVREVRYHRSSSVLSTVLVAVAVFGVVVPGLLSRTAGVGTSDRISRVVGAADYRVDTTLQAVDRPEAAQFAGPDQVEFTSTAGRVRTADGAVVAQLTTAPYADPLTLGILLPESGRAPEHPGEAAVTPALAERLGVRLGEPLELETNEKYTVVGTYLDPGSTAALGVVLPPEAALPGYAVATVSLLGVGDPAGQAELLAERVRTARETAAGPVVVRTAADAAQQSGGALDESQKALLIIIISLGLLQFALLISATMAIATARQRRVLALLAASGGAPRHLRATVLAHGFVVGVAGSALGIAAGLVAARAVAPAFLALKDQLFVGLVVKPLDLLAAALLGVLTTILSAFPPSRMAGRIPPVAVLGRIDRDPSALTVPRPKLAGGLIMLGAAGVLSSAGGDRVNVAPTLISVVLIGAGLLALLPLLLTRLARSATGAPLAIRLAVRDVQRHQTRCLPAIAVIAAASAATVAVSTFIYSDTTAAERAYVPPYRADELHVETVSLSDHTVARSLLDEIGRIIPLRAAAPISYAGTASVQSPGWKADGSYSLISANRDASRPGLAAPPAPVAVGGPELAGLLGGPTARAANERGEAVALAPHLVQDSSTTLTVSGSGELRSITVPVRLVARPGPLGAAGVILPLATARQLSLPVTDAGWLLAGAGPLTPEQVRRATETITAGSRATTRTDAGFDAYGAPRSETALLWLLVSIAVTLGSTIFATGLAAAEARADMTLLALMGARRVILRRLRIVQALLIAGVGAASGTLLGLAPSLLVYARREGDYVLIVPWYLVAAVAVGLPVLAALLMILTTPPQRRRSRQRLPVSAVAATG